MILIYNRDSEVRPYRLVGTLISKDGEAYIVNKYGAQRSDSYDGFEDPEVLARLIRRYHGPLAYTDQVDDYPDTLKDLVINGTD